MSRTRARRTDGRGPDRPIIIVGCARSGTTLLQSMLNAHPRVGIPPENRFMLPLYARRVEFGDLRETQGVEAFLVALGEDGRQLADLQLDSRRLRRELHAAPSTIGSLLGTVLAEYASARGKPRWGDKRPNYIRSLPRIVELFPDAQVLHIVRDGRDSVASLMTMPWWNERFEDAVVKWRRAVRYGIAARQGPPSSYHELRYEDLVADPGVVLEDVCVFLGEAFDEAMLVPSRVADLTPDYKSWHKRLREPVNAAAVNRWERELSPEQVGLFESVAADELREHGYELSGRGVAPGREALERWTEAKRLNRRRERRRLRRHREASEVYGHPVAAALTQQQRQLAAEQGWLVAYDGPG